ncbi:MAG: hypothetical protein ACP5JG_09390 [Anaerolineae bacterium]
MILARTGNNEILLGTVQSLGAVGGLIGGLTLSAWGGPKRRIHGVLLGMVAMRLFGQCVLGLGRTGWIWMVANFTILFFTPVINGANQAIWQAKVAPAYQGRVFSARRLIAQFPTSFAMTVVGPLADRFFEPAMAPGGALATRLGWLVGTGPGAGMALMMVFAGVIGASVGLVGYLVPIVRDVEKLLRDHDFDPQGWAAVLD